MKSYIERISWALYAVTLSIIFITIFNLPEPVLWSLRIAIITVIFYNIKSCFNKTSIDSTGLYITILYIGWLFIGFIRAAYFSEGYWMWKSVVLQLIIASFYSIIIISSNINIVQKYFTLYWKYSILLVAILMLFHKSPLLLSYLPYSVLLLFFPLIPKKQKWALLTIVLFFFYINYQRNDKAKIVAIFTIGLYISHLYKILPKWSVNFIHVSLLLTPLFLLWLGYTGMFNVFKIDEYIKSDYSQTINSSDGILEENLKADTRSFIYKNINYTMNKYDAWIMGRSPAFGDEGVSNFWGKDDATGLTGRYGNEVGISDILLWYGLIGVLLYFFIYIRASFLSIYKSKSKYAKGIGLYVSFLWMWSFVWEKPMFETFFMIDLILIGLCFSTRFRQMNDSEVKEWIKCIFISQKLKRKKPYIEINESSLDLQRDISRSLRRN